jgi:acetone carboxylase gamma subunit
MFLCYVYLATSSWSIRGVVCDREGFFVVRCSLAFIFCRQSLIVIVVNIQGDSVVVNDLVSVLATVFPRPTFGHPEWTNIRGQFCLM